MKGDGGGTALALAFGILGLWLCFWGGIGYVAWHFITKFW